MQWIKVINLESFGFPLSDRTEFNNGVGVYTANKVCGLYYFWFYIMLIYLIVCQ